MPQSKLNPRCLNQPAESPARDPNNMAYWWPRLKRTGVAVPRTELVRTEGWDPYELLNKPAPPEFHDLVLDCCQAVENFGPPCFLRCGTLSAKHDWARTCYIADTHPTRMSQHLRDIIETAAMADQPLEAVQVWAVRELLPIEASFAAFRGLPIGRERRYFFDAAGHVVCHHPYWPSQAISQGTLTERLPRDWRDLLVALNEEPADEVEHLTALTAEVAAQFPGAAWSLDWAYARRPGQTGRWYAIDMAQAARSWHPEPCPGLAAVGGHDHDV